MNTNTLNHNALTHLVEANAINSATATADGDTWALNILVGDTDKTVMAKNSGKARIWRKLDTLARYLQKMGINKFQIDVSNYDPSQKSLTRPDSASTLKRTHRAHKSFQQQSFNQIASTEQSSEQQVREKWEERRAKILREENPRAHVSESEA